MRWPRRGRRALLSWIDYFNNLRLTSCCNSPSLIALLQEVAQVSSKRLQNAKV